MRKIIVYVKDLQNEVEKRLKGDKESFKTACERNEIDSKSYYSGRQMALRELALHFGLNINREYL